MAVTMGDRGGAGRNADRRIDAPKTIERGAAISAVAALGDDFAGRYIAKCDWMNVCGEPPVPGARDHGRPGRAVDGCGHAAGVVPAERNLMYERVIREAPLKWTSNGSKRPEVPSHMD